MLTNLCKTPWPWFGGKSPAAVTVWKALGDPAHYVEPFAGSLAVLLRRPCEANRTYYSETVNDLDGLLVNAWRSMQFSPDAMAAAASWPVSEADLMARHLRLVQWRNERNLELLMADPEWHDPVMGGWWAWGQSCWIGSGWCRGNGAWHVGEDGRIAKQPRGERESGVAHQLPHLGNNGQGVNHPGTRESGVELEHEYHPMTMPELTRWFRFLSARLRHVRILNGDWHRAVTNSASKTLAVRMGDAAKDGACGIFLDPPYGEVRTTKLYASDSLTVAADVRQWCLEHGDDPQLRIVLAGFVSEHGELETRGWTAVEWYRAGFLKGGMGNMSGTDEDGKVGNQQANERLWLSPHCLRPVAEEQAQQSMFSQASQQWNT